MDISPYTTPSQHRHFPWISFLCSPPGSSRSSGHLEELCRPLVAQLPVVFAGLPALWHPCLPDAWCPGQSAARILGRICTELLSAAARSAVVRVYPPPARSASLVHHWVGRCVPSPASMCQRYTNLVRTFASRSGALKRRIYLHVTMNHQSFVWPVRVDPNSTGMVNAVWCSPSLPTTLSAYTAALWFKLSWITRLHETQALILPIPTDHGGLCYVNWEEEGSGWPCIQW